MSTYIFYFYRNFIHAYILGYAGDWKTKTYPDWSRRVHNKNTEFDTQIGKIICFVL